MLTKLMQVISYDPPDSEVDTFDLQVYINPYDFGRRRNWRLFLGVVRGRTWRHVLLPSPHKPTGEGLTWHTVHSDTENDSDEENSNRREYMKDP